MPRFIDKSIDLGDLIRKFDRLSTQKKRVASLLKAEVNIDIKTMSGEKCGLNCDLFFLCLTISYPLKEDGGNTEFEREFRSTDELSAYLDAMENALLVSKGEEA